MYVPYHKKMIELSHQEWIELLSKEYKQNDEEVVLISRIRKSGELAIKKNQYEYFFGKPVALEFKPGKEIEIICRKGEPRKPSVPEWVLAQLKINGSSNTSICITRKKERFFLKAFDIRHINTKIAGPIVFDDFSAKKVIRSYSCISDIEHITNDYIDELFAMIGKFKHNPFDHLKNTKGFIGFLSRRDITGKIASDDIAFVNSYKKGIFESQENNGSWMNRPVKTAFNVIRLLELGCNPKESPLKKATDWLLSLPEPVGLPGLFLFSENIAKSFNKWKSKNGVKGRPFRKHVASEINEFTDNLDINGILSANPCETRITWSSAIVIEALLKAGLYKESRMIKAINTLLLLSDASKKPAGVWCGCGYMDAKYKIRPETSAIDFNWPNLNNQYSSGWFSSWFSGDDISTLTSGGDSTNQTIKIAGNRAMVISLKESLACNLNMHRVLSHHPNYPGSKLEELGILAYASNQNSLGLWNHAYCSSMLDALCGFKNPLASFLVLRTIPILKRTQEKDGMWQEEQLSYHARNETLYKTTPPTKEESTYRILKTLKKYQVLDKLT